MIDFHSHVLPGMDDGSHNSEESNEMIRQSFEQGVEILVATPHFYPWQDQPDRFLERRNASVEALGKTYDNLLIGAEVAYYDGMGNSEEIEKLRIEETNLLLVEMPVTVWTERMVEDLHHVENKTNLKLVLAHIERYIKCQKGTDNIDYVCNNFLIQVSVDYFIDWKTQRKALKLMKKDYIDFIGSDCHNLTTRPPNIQEAYQTMIDKLGTQSVETFLDKQTNYLREGRNYEK
ncbi:CpsB/CapC family capsule biosynthesis tyrosine phosphatase [Eubacteriaceae bacterium ES3]|nr:CpsB/CapC family capsule biosynthesis tyrosine phosphatase [Eubacteriaceae bacterium ES3]